MAKCWALGCTASCTYALCLQSDPGWVPSLPSLNPTKIDLGSDKCQNCSTWLRHYCADGYSRTMPCQSDLKLLCRSKTLPRLDHHLVNLAPSLVTPRCQSVALAYLTFSHQRSYSVSLPLLGVACVEQISPPTHPSSLAFSPAPTSSCQFCHQRSTPLSYRTMHPCPSSIQSRSVYSLAYRHQISPKSRS